MVLSVVVALVVSMMVIGFFVDALGLGSGDEVAVDTPVYLSPVDACRGAWAFFLRAGDEVMDDATVAPHLRAIGEAARRHDVAIGTAVDDMRLAASTADVSEVTERLLRRCISLGWEGPTEDELGRLLAAKPAP